MKPNRMSCLPLIRKVYPNALSTDEAVDRLLNMMCTRLGLEPKQIMSADSICCDDVNSLEYPHRAFEMLGPFKMGGLDGYPFAGLTGMGAFASHVPQEGALFVYFGPHIGINKNEKIGEIYRYGQDRSSSCCGALVAGLKKLLNNEIVEGHVTDLDYQMNTLEQILFRNRDKIIGQENPILAATEVIYQAIQERIDLLVSKTKFPTRHVVLMGAILINGDVDVGSFSACRRLTCHDMKKDITTDWMTDFDNNTI